MRPTDPISSPEHTLEHFACLLWKHPRLDGDAFRDALLAAVAPLAPLRVLVADSAVAAAAGRRIGPDEALPDGLLVLPAGDAALATVLAPLVARWSLLRLEVREPLPLPAMAPGRVPGMCQLALLQVPSRLSREAWLERWLTQHTPVAIATQGTFGYRQQPVLAQAGGTEVAVDALVEENFPAAAMASDAAFYGVAEDDAAGLAERAGRMLESCARFIDFEDIRVVPMSEYRLAGVA